MKIAFAMVGLQKRYFIGGKLRPFRGGAERVLVELANELSERGHEVTIFCTGVNMNSRDEFVYSISPQVQYHNLLETKSPPPPQL